MRKVRARGGATNPWAVCTASIGGGGNPHRKHKVGNPIGSRWIETVQKALRSIGGGAKEWWTAPTPDPLPKDFQERLGEDINLLDIFPGGAGVGALTRKAAVGQAARGWRRFLRHAPEWERTALKTERKEMAQAVAKMPKERLKPMEDVNILLRRSTMKAGMGAKGKYFGKFYYFPGEIPEKVLKGRKVVDPSPLEAVAHEVLGHLQALSPKKAGEFKKFFREINRSLKGGPRAHERFAGRMGELTERYHKMKPGPMTMEDVKVLTETAMR